MKIGRNLNQDVIGQDKISFWNNPPFFLNVGILSLIILHSLRKFKLYSAPVTTGVSSFAKNETSDTSKDVFKNSMRRQQNEFRQSLTTLRNMSIITLPHPSFHIWRTFLWRSLLERLFTGSIYVRRWKIYWKQEFMGVKKVCLVNAFFYQEKLYIDIISCSKQA